MIIQRPLFTTANAGFGLPVWFWLGAGVYVLLLVNGNALLNDTDTHWHIAVGKWILDHNSFPHADIYSFTKKGEPWISTSWLAQVLYAGSYDIGGWAGPIRISGRWSALLAGWSEMRVATDGSHSLSACCGSNVPAKLLTSHKSY